MSTTESGPARRFGELLVAESLVTAAQVEEAVHAQSTMNDYEPLGHILVSRGFLTRRQLVGALRRYRKSARLGELLVRSRRITPGQLQVALAHQKSPRQPLGHSLRTLGFCSEETLREALCAQLHVNFFDLDHIAPDAAVARLVTERYAIRHRIIPLFRAGQALVVAVDDPADVTTIDELQQMLGLRVEIVTSTAAKIQRALASLYGGPRPPADPTRYPNVLIGTIRDPEIADLAAMALRVRMLPPSWQMPVT
jgi:chorismate-pyruvate lyase